MPDSELDVLLVENLADLDAAARYLENDLQPRIGAALDDICKTFMSQNNWVGMSDWDEDETWLASPGWRMVDESDGNEFRCKVWLEDVASRDGVEDRFWLTYLLSAGVQSLGLRWRRTDVRSKRAWRKALATQVELISSLRVRGFEYEEAEGTFLLPVRIDFAQLSEALRDENPEKGLEGLNQALQKLINAKPEFDALLTGCEL